MGEYIEVASAVSVLFYVMGEKGFKQIWKVSVKTLVVVLGTLFYYCLWWCFPNYL